MSVNKNKIIAIDNLGFNYTGELFVNAITIRKNTDVATVYIRGADNVPVLDYADSVANKRFDVISFACPQYIRDLNVDIFTGVDRVTFYIDRFGND